MIDFKSPNSLPQLMKVAKTLSLLEETFQCSICLDILRNPVRLKCVHVFCRRCVEDLIRVSQRNHQPSKCPLCNVGGITKRGLEADTKTPKMIEAFETLMAKLEEEHGVDFKDVRFRTNTREAPTPNLKMHLTTRSTPISTISKTAKPVVSQASSKKSSNSKEVTEKPSSSKIAETSKSLSTSKETLTSNSKAISENPSTSQMAVTRQIETKERVSFRLGCPLRPQSPATINEDSSSINDRTPRIIPFLKLGRMCPPEDRKAFSLDEVPAFSTILEKKRRHSSGRSKEDYAEMEPLNKRSKEENYAQEDDGFDSLIPASETITEVPIEQRAPAEEIPGSNGSEDLFNDPDEDNLIAGRTSPSPGDIYFSQEQPVTSVMESDDDLLFTTPQKDSPKRRFKWKNSGKNEPNLTAIQEIEDEDKENMILVCSGLSTGDRKTFDDFIQKFGIRQKPCVDNQVTHLVANVNVQNCADRTLKFLQAITNRCWIVNLNWVRDCLRHGKLIKPDGFEVSDLNNEPGPQRARLSEKNSKLFGGFEISLSGTFAGLKKDDLTALLVSEGAKIVRSVHSMSFNKKGLVVMDANCPQKKEAERHFKAYQLPTVTSDWVLDSISSFNVQPIFSFLVNTAKVEEIQQLGY